MCINTSFQSGVNWSVPNCRHGPVLFKRIENTIMTKKYTFMMNNQKLGKRTIDFVIFFWKNALKRFKKVYKRKIG